MYLAALARTESIRAIAVTDPSHDLLAELRRETADLREGHALVVSDGVGLDAGRQVRRAVDALLCERADLWVEYRPFVDLDSRLTIIRGDAAMRTPPPDEADAAKWEPSHQPIAATLAPLIAGLLAPSSVVDLGCGAGYWLQALQAHGVSTTVGITPRNGGDAAAPDVVRAPLAAVPAQERRFDVCLCLEVAHRVSPAEQDALIAACARLSDVVVFSSRPPGFPGHGPHDRPMPYWAQKFWRHGYVLDDVFRPRFENGGARSRSVFDGLIVFRRCVDDAAMVERSPLGRALAACVRSNAVRVHELWMDSIWIGMAERRAGSRVRPLLSPPRTSMVAWPIPRRRLVATTGPARVFRFRTDEARWYLTHHAATLRVLEDGRELRQVGEAAAVATASGGAWSLWRDEVTMASSDGTDPRASARTYQLVVPEHVALAESGPLDARGAA
jgi:hypothetical protein